MPEPFEVRPMAEKRGTKGVPFRLGDELSDDDEATALDLDLAGVREALAARQAEGQGAAPAKRAPPPSVADDDPDKTEMIERPDLGEISGGAPARGVVPLGSDAAKLLGRSSGAPAETPSTDVFSADMSDEAETVMMTRPRDPPDVRALDELSLPPISSEMSDDQTLSRPKIARMTFRPGDAPQHAESGPEGPGGTPPRMASPDGTPPPRPLPPPLSARRLTGSAVEAAPNASGLADGGVLVVDAPPGAAVFVDGVERGSGRVEVSALDRFARVAVRVHRAGFKPWHRTLSLEGRQELRVVPELEPR